MSTEIRDPPPPHASELEHLPLRTRAVPPAHRELREHVRLVVLGAALRHGVGGQVGVVEQQRSRTDVAVPGRLQLVVPTVSASFTRFRNNTSVKSL